MKIYARTIRKQILHPFLTILIVLPIVIIVFLNIGITFIVQNSAKKELASTMTTMESLLNSSEENASGETFDLARELSAGLTAAKLAGNTGFYIFYEQKILYPLDIQGDTVASYFEKEMAAGNIKADDPQIQKCRIDGNSCFYKCVLLAHYHDYKNLSILFVTDLGEYSSWMLSINAVLFVILILAVSVSAILALRIADSISRPIIDACTYAAEIGNGDFITVPIEESNEEIKQFCTSLNAMSKRLKDYDDTQKQFLQNASHELRTPLMSIQGYAEGIENEVFPEPKEAAEVIRKESLRLNNLVTELLTLSRIENHTYAHKMELYNISDLLMDYIQRVNGLLLGSSLRVKLELAEQVPALLDESLFSQTVINILSNAIRYAKEEIVVRTYLETEGEAVFCTVEVADDGDGIAEQELPHLFERFYKGEKGNFGLGLAISKSAMESMGGSLQALNRNGAVFLMKLPYAKERDGQMLSFYQK